MTKLSEYLHTSGEADYLGFHHNSVKKGASRGNTPIHRNLVNNYRLFKRSDLDKRLKQVAKSVTRTT